MGGHEAVAMRERLVRERGLVVLHVFDTNEHEPDKDVCRVQDASGRSAILRVGEVRPVGVFEEGFSGKTCLVPKRYAHGEEPAWELEEDLDAPELIAVDLVPLHAETLVRPDLQAQLIRVFWETQTAWVNEPLPVQPQVVATHLAPALALLTQVEGARVQACLASQTAFFADLYPSKWKFSKDNILLLADGRLGLIDLARVGRRYWGYDLGWVYWPQWWNLSVEQLQDVSGYVKRLEVFFEQVVALQPEQAAVPNVGVLQALWLGCGVRVVGGLYDLAESVSHARTVIADESRREELLRFLKAVLDRALDHVERMA